MSEEFSIIVPVYNRAKIVLRTLDSIKNQTYRPIHLIVVDNASTDDTFDVVTKWGRENASDQFRISLLKESQRGAPAARNKGFQAATSDKIMFFDSDDTMRPGLATLVMEGFRDNPTSDVITWRCMLHHINGTSHLKHHLPGDPWTLHIYHGALSTQAYAVRRSFFAKIGAWDASMKVWDDWELGVRILLAHPIIHTIPQTLVDIYAQTISITGTNFSSKAGEWEKALRRADEHIDANIETVTKEERPALERLHRLISYRRVILAAHYYREKRHDLAHTLLEGTLNDPEHALSPTHRRLLRFCYHFTRIGLPGASHLVDPLL